MFWDLPNELNILAIEVYTIIKLISNIFVTSVVGLLEKMKLSPTKSYLVGVQPSIKHFFIVI